MKEIDRLKYPELNLILWDRAERYITAENAFEAYQLRWRHVCEKELTGPERTLIADLTRTVGKGLFLAA